MVRAKHATHTHACARRPTSSAHTAFHHAHVYTPYLAQVPGMSALTSMCTSTSTSLGIREAGIRTAEQLLIRQGIRPKLSKFDLPLPPFDCVQHSAQSIIRWIPAVTALIIPLSNSPTPAYGFPAQTLGRVFAHCHSCGKKRSSGPKPTINPGKFKRSAPEQRSVSQCSWTMFCKTRVT